MAPHAFPDVFSECLALSGLTHMQVAERMGVTGGFISQCASGHSKLPLRFVPAIIEVCQLSAPSATLLARAAIAQRVPADVLALAGLAVGHAADPTSPGAA
jgi:hypothetical protein